MIHPFIVFSLFFFVLFSPLASFAQGFGGKTSFGARKDLGSDVNILKNKPLNTKEESTGFASNSSGMEEWIQYQIHVLGRVKTPGTYRLSPSTRLDEAIGKAQGIEERGSLRRIELRRGGRTIYYDLFKFQRFGDLDQNPFLLDNDVIYVPFTENNVAIHGPVKSNSVFELTRGEKSIWDLIELAGGFTIGVSEKASIIVVRFNEGKKNLIEVPNIRKELENFELLNGDIVIVPHVLVKNHRFDYNVAELPADSMYYPTQQNDIYITGAVAQAGAFPFNPAFSIRDFINMAGPTEIANLNSVYVLTAGGKQVKNPERKKAFRLSPGDTVIVPKRHLTTDNVLRWYNTFTGTIFSGFAFKQLLLN